MEHYYVIIGKSTDADLNSKRNFTIANKEEAEKYHDDLLRRCRTCLMIHVDKYGAEQIVDREVERIPRSRYTGAISAEDDIYTVAEFEENVENGCFCSTDGCGYWVKDGLSSSAEVFDSKQEDATHVVWYNQ